MDAKRHPHRIIPWFNYCFTEERSRFIFGSLRINMKENIASSKYYF
jgi:hypothetical protein